MKHLHPFEAETVPSGMADMLWSYAVAMAQQSLRNGVEVLREYESDDNKIPWVYDLGREMVSRSRLVMLPFLHGIEYRTKQELKAARRRVEQCEAHFIITSCADETCSECEAPLWQHIATTMARYCPRDGRPYWQLVRAILSESLSCVHRFARACPACTLAVREALAPIARENRSKTAKPSRRQHGRNMA